MSWLRFLDSGIHRVLLVANGVGANRAAAAVDAAVPAIKPDAIVTTGFCGALDESLAIGDIVIGTRIGDYECALPSASLPHQRGPIASIDRVAQTADEKRRLRSSGSIAVEMEAAGVARRAAALGLPLYCIKAVTDLATENMANDFNAALRSGGQFDTIVLFQGALRRPTKRIPELIRLRNRCVRAARALGEFFADCRF